MGQEVELEHGIDSLRGLLLLSFFPSLLVHDLVVEFVLLLALVNQPDL